MPVHAKSKRHLALQSLTSSSREPTQSHWLEDMGQGSQAPSLIKNQYEKQQTIMFQQYVCMGLNLMENSGKQSLFSSTMQHFKQPIGFTMNQDWQRVGAKERGLWTVVRIKLHQTEGSVWTVTLKQFAVSV